VASMGRAADREADRAGGGDDGEGGGKMRSCGLWWSWWGAGKANRSCGRSWSRWGGMMAEEQLRTGGGVDEGESMAMAVGGGPRTSD
jgi:hypothetical protein